jgi:hypothetical protein
MVSDSFNSNAAICMKSADAAYPDKPEPNPFSQSFENDDARTMMTTNNGKFARTVKQSKSIKSSP